MSREKKTASPKIEQQLTDDPLEPEDANPSLNSEIRAATTIQSSVTPEDYPAADREAQADIVGKPRRRKG